MINRYDYQTKDTERSKDCEQGVVVLEGHGVLARRNDHPLEAEVRRSQRHGKSVDRCLPVFVRGHAGHQERLPLGADSEARAVRRLEPADDPSGRGHERREVDECGAVAPASGRHIGDELLSAAVPLEMVGEPVARQGRTAENADRPARHDEVFSVAHQHERPQRRAVLQRLPHRLQEVCGRALRRQVDVDLIDRLQAVESGEERQ